MAFVGTIAPPEYITSLALFDFSAFLLCRWTRCMYYNFGASTGCLWRRLVISCIFHVLFYFMHSYLAGGCDAEFSGRLTHPVITPGQPSDEQHWIGPSFYACIHLLVSLCFLVLAGASTVERMTLHSKPTVQQSTLSTEIDDFRKLLQAQRHAQ